MNIDTVGANCCGAYAAYAAKGDSSAGKANGYLWIILGLVIFSACILVIFPAFFLKKRHQMELMAYRDDVTGRDNLTSWKQKFSQSILWRRTGTAMLCSFCMQVLMW